jgi:FtsZ-binding cell division protein ZapB
MSAERSDEDKNPVFGNPEVNKIKRERNNLQRENEKLKKRINFSKTERYERKETAKALLILMACLSTIAYQVWFR